nr:hypothetical protein [Streptomyces sp. XY431]
MQGLLHEQMIGTGLTRGRPRTSVVRVVGEMANLLLIKTVSQRLAAASEQRPAPVRVVRMPPPPNSQHCGLGRENDRPVGVSVPDHSGLYPAVIDEKRWHTDTPATIAARNEPSRWCHAVLRDIALIVELGPGTG